VELVQALTETFRDQDSCTKDSSITKNSAVKAAGSEDLTLYNMAYQHYLDEVEADLQGWGPLSMPFRAQVNDHGYGSNSLMEQVQGEHPSQLPRAPSGDFLQHTQPPYDPFALPTLENAAWTEYLQDAHYWQLGGSFVSLSLAQQGGAAIPPVAFPSTPGPTQQARPPASPSPQQLPSGNGGYDTTALVQPLREPTELTKQVILEIINRLNAQGAGIDKQTLNIEAAEHIFAIYATPAEKAAIQEEYEPYGQPEVPHESYQSAHMELNNQPDKPDQADRQTHKELNAADIRDQLSPTRLEDGSGLQFHNKHNRLHLRTKCFPCHVGKYKCDRNEKPDGICSRCAHRAEIFPNIFDANEICVKEETAAFKDFKATRAVFHGKAKPLGMEDWSARKQARQDGKAKEKKEREARS